MLAYCSAEISELAKALIAAQRELLPAARDGTNPFTRSNYSTLNSVMEACRDVLRAHGIWMIQLPALHLWSFVQDLEQFRFETLRVPNHTACLFAEKARFFRLVWAGRRCAAASRFAFEKKATCRKRKKKHPSRPRRAKKGNEKGSREVPRPQRKKVTGSPVTITKKGHGHLRDPCLRTGAEGGTRTRTAIATTPSR